MGIKDEKFANEVFEAMDANHDGQLSNEGLFIFKKKFLN